MKDQKEISMAEVTADNVYAKIGELIEGNELIVFIKGSSTMPMCGFSARVIEILNMNGADYKTVNVLDNMIVREGIKKFSNWPTIPQIYFKGEFIGGCDIVSDMHQNGELKELLAGG